MCIEKHILQQKKEIYICEDCYSSFEKPSTEQGIRLFISYGHDKNQILVKKIKDYLAARGFDVWIDTSEIRKGFDWREQITTGLLASKEVLAFLSEHSVRNPGVCIDELRIAMRLKNAYVKSIMLEDPDNVNPPYRLSDRQWIDMSDWSSIPAYQWNTYFEEKMQELLEVLNSAESVSFEKDMKFISDTLGINELLSKEYRLLKEDFVGRKWFFDKIDNWLKNSTNKRMVLFGCPGSGKSALAANLYNIYPEVIAAVFLNGAIIIYQI